MRFTILLSVLMVVSQQAATEVEIHSEYHAPTDLFVLMDGVSQWYFNDPAYRQAWEDRFDWSKQDKKLAKMYRKYRSRTYHDPAQNNLSLAEKPDGIFAARSSYDVSVDPLAEHFINADTIEQALLGFNTMASAEDATMLVNFYRHFQPQWQEILNESLEFKNYADSLNNELKKNAVAAYLNRIGEFYGVQLDLTFKARFVWWPPIDRTLADVSGHTIFLRLNPQKHIASDDWDEIIMHEFVHYVSAHQSSEQKKALSQLFLEKCSFKSKNYYDYIEEPMAVAWGQAAFAKYVKGHSLDPSLNWYNKPIPDVMGKLLWLKVDDVYSSKTVLDKSFMQFVADHCTKIIKIR